MALTPGWKRKPPKPHTYTLPRSEEDPTLMVTCKDIGGDDDGGPATMAHCARVTGSRSTQVTTSSLSCSTPDRSTLTLLHTWPVAFLPTWWCDENHLRLSFSWSTDSFHSGGSDHISCKLIRIGNAVPMQWLVGSKNHFQISSAYICPAFYFEGQLWQGSVCTTLRDHFKYQRLTVTPSKPRCWLCIRGT